MTVFKMVVFKMVVFKSYQSFPVPNQVLCLVTLMRVYDIFPLLFFSGLTSTNRESHPGNGANQTRSSFQLQKDFLPRHKEFQGNRFLYRIVSFFAEKIRTDFPFMKQGQPMTF